MASDRSETTDRIVEKSGLDFASMNPADSDTSK